MAVPALGFQRVTITREITNTYRTTAYIFGAVGIAGAITYGITAGLMAKWYSDAEDAGCPKKDANRPGTCPEEARQDVESGKAVTPINTISLIVVAVGVVGAAGFATHTVALVARMADSSQAQLPT